MSDRRSPHTDALDTLGTIHQFDESRDAIHLAVVQVTAGHVLQPGAYICFRGGSGTDRSEVVACARGQALGIIDPFIPGAITSGQQCWMVLMPGSVRSLRHAWEHPDIPTVAVEPANEEPVQVEWTKYPRLNCIASEMELEPEDLVHEFVTAFTNGNDYYRGGSEAEGVYAGEEFWTDMMRFARDHSRDDINAIIDRALENHTFGNNWISCSC